mgnify:FL=1
MFVVKKYIKAFPAKEALKKEKKQEADDCWIDDDWRKEKKDRLAEAIGFKIT